MTIFEKIGSLDRRIIFVLITLAVVIPLILEVTFPEYPTKMTRDLYNAIDNLPSGSLILFSMDYDPSTEPEVKPMTIAMTRHALMKNHKICFITLWAPGQQLIKELQKNLIEKEFPEKKYGIDYADFGYKAGYQGVIAVISTSWNKLYSTDAYHTPTEKLPMMKGVQSLSDSNLMISVTAGFPGTKEWIQFGTDPANLKIISGTTAVQAPFFYPYYPKQLSGLLAGIKGAAEYESMIAEKFERYRDKKMHKGILIWGPQTVAHIVIVVLILIGNLSYFMTRRKKG